MFSVGVLVLFCNISCFCLLTSPLSGQPRPAGGLEQVSCAQPSCPGPWAVWDTKSDPAWGCSCAPPAPRAAGSTAGCCCRCSSAVQNSTDTARQQRCTGTACGRGGAMVQQLLWHLERALWEGGFGTSDKAQCKYRYFYYIRLWTRTQVIRVVFLPAHHFVRDGSYLNNLISLRLSSTIWAIKR